MDLDAGEYIVHRFPGRWYVQTAQVVLPYDAEEMTDVVSMIAEQRGISPGERLILSHRDSLDELSGWKFDREELLQIHATLKHCRNDQAEDDKDDEIEDMDMEDVVLTDDDDIEEEYLEWDGAEDESWAESPVVQLDRESILAAFSRGLHEA